MGPEDPSVLSKNTSVQKQGPGRAPATCPGHGPPTSHLWTLIPWGTSHTHVSLQKPELGKDLPITPPCSACSTVMRRDEGGLCAQKGRSPSYVTGEAKFTLVEVLPPAQPRGQRSLSLYLDAHRHLSPHGSPARGTCRRRTGMHGTLSIAHPSRFLNFQLCE